MKNIFRKACPKVLTNRRGFSLLEMVIYVAILVVLLVVIFNIVISVSQSHKGIEASRAVETSAAVALERISREIRDASSINTGSSTFGSNPGVLVLSGTDGLGNPRTVEFYLSTSTIYIKENGVELGPLTEDNAFVTSLIFRLYSTSTSMGIRTETTIESGTTTYYKSANFYNSTTIR